MSLAHAVYAPPGPGPHPTIFALHGYGSNALDLLGLAPELLGGRVLMIAPQGPDDVVVEGPGGPQVAGHGWFPITLTNPPRPHIVAKAVQAARDFVDDAMTRHPVDRSRVAVLGFSQGGVLAYALALTDPQRYRALVALSTWLPEDLAKALPAVDRSQLAALVQHGRRDEVVAPGRGRSSAAILRTLGVATTHNEYEMAHEINPQSFADLDAWLGTQLG